MKLGILGRFRVLRFAKDLSGLSSDDGTFRFRIIEDEDVIDEKTQGYITNGWAQDRNFTVEIDNEEIRVVAGEKSKLTGETNTPLGCDKANNRYYDFIETKECLRPVTYEQLYILDRFRDAYKFAQDNPEQTIEIQVAFNRYPSEEEFNALIDEKVSEVRRIAIYYPSYAGGTTAPSVITDASITKDTALQWVLNNHLQRFSQDTTLNEAYGEFEQSMVNKYQLYGVNLTMEAKEIPEWWVNHMSLVRVVQPIVSDLDAAQTLYKPEETIGSEDQTIHWE